MENQTGKTSFNIIEKICDRTTEQNIDTQISLPDYCSDIRKILKCFVLPDIFACSLSGDRVTADGEATVRVLYIGDSGKTECYEQCVPFSKYIELDEPQTDSCAGVTAATEYVNCRAVSQRRISVSAGLSLHFCVSRLKKETLFCPCEEDSFETKNEIAPCCEPKGICEKIFEMSETIALNENSEPACAIIRADTVAIIDSVKTVSDKMLIKGDMITEILYCTDTQSALPEKYRHTMPISQIVDLEGLSETSLCDVTIKIMSVSARLKTDTEGKNRMFDISVRACACVRAYENCEVCAVSDGYSVSYETDAEFKNMTFRNHLFTYRETKQLRNDIEISSSDISQITDAFALSCDGKAFCEDGRLKVRGEMSVGLLYMNKEGECGYTEKTLDFNFDISAVQNDPKICAEPDFTVTDISSVISGSSGVQLRISLLVNMAVFEEKELRVCTRMDIIEDKKKPSSSLPLTVYYSTEGEKIWDIARAYNTTSEKIREDNDLSGDEVEENRILLITSV